MRKRKPLKSTFCGRTQALNRLCRFVARWPKPCCLHSSILADEMVDRGVDVTVLENDDQRVYVRGFLHYDVCRPRPLDQRFGLIICEPIGLTFSMTQFCTAISVLSQQDFRQKILLCCSRRQRSAVQKCLSEFRVRATGFRPRHQLIEGGKPTGDEFYSNLDARQMRQLVGP